MHERKKPDLKIVAASGESAEDNAKELEDLAVKLREDLRIINVLHGPFKGPLDPHIIRLCNGMDIILELAEEGGRRRAPSLIDASIRGFVKLVDEAHPPEAYASDAKAMAQTLEALNEAMFNSQLLDLPQKFPSFAWQDKRTSDALHEGLAHAAQVVGILNPQQPGEGDAAYNQRLQAYVLKAAADIRKKAENPPI